MDALDADYTPRYIMLARLLRGSIEDGTYPPGSLLPSSARLAEAHTVSKATARHALGVLVKSGHARHVESKPHQVIWRLADQTGSPGDVRDYEMAPREDLEPSISSASR